MSKPEFTPGPWVAGRPDMASIVDGVDSKWIYAGDEYVAIASGRVTGEWSTVIANAHLIAAAPELYAASEPFDELATQQAVDSPERRDSDSVTVVVTIGALRAIRAARIKATHPSGGDRHGE